MGKREKSPTAFRHNLCSLMLMTKMSIRDAAVIAGVPVSTLANWRSGATPADFHALIKLAKHFGVTLEELLTQELQVNRSTTGRLSAGEPEPSGKKISDKEGVDEVIFEGRALVRVERASQKRARVMVKTF